MAAAAAFSESFFGDFTKWGGDFLTLDFFLDLSGSFLQEPLGGDFYDFTQRQIDDLIVVL